MEVSKFGDEDTPDNCDNWADDCFIIKEDYSDFPLAKEFEELGMNFRKKAAELRAESYGV
jgi:hypothetical protein